MAGLFFLNNTPDFWEAVAEIASDRDDTPLVFDSLLASRVSGSGIREI
jgi:hypothetical protein